jgi:hypothetical protein
MKIRDIVETRGSDGSVATLRKDIIDQVKKTQDEELLDKIYTVLNQSGLADRIAGTLERDTDTRGYTDIITQIIIDTPGTFQAKYDFINGFPTGYVDIDKMLSGNRVKFTDLLTGGKFVVDVFNRLKRETFGSAKGPGEFALAVMSPHIRINGKGDLNIGDQIIEVKASAGKEVSSGGGRLGEGGLIKYDDVAKIIEKNIKAKLSVVAPNGVGLAGLTKLASNMPGVQRMKFGKELFGYMFSGSGANISDLVSAFANGTDLRDAYVKANYDAYKAKSEFDGIMIMNFALGELHFFRDVNDLVRHVYNGIGVYIVSSDTTKSARQILTQVTLAPFKEPAVALPDVPTDNATPQVTAEFEQSVLEFCVDFSRQQGTDPDTVPEMYQLVMNMFADGKNIKSVMTKLKKEYPKTKSAPAGGAPAPTTEKKPAPAAPAEPAPADNNELNTLKKNAGITTPGTATV